MKLEAPAFLMCVAYIVLAGYCLGCAGVLAENEVSSFIFLKIIFEGLFCCSLFLFVLALTELLGT
jgi:hypothetical protein